MVVVAKFCSTTLAGAVVRRVSIWPPRRLVVVEAAHTAIPDSHRFVMKNPIVAQTLFGGAVLVLAYFAPLYEISVQHFIERLPNIDWHEVNLVLSAPEYEFVFVLLHSGTVLLAHLRRL